MRGKAINHVLECIDIANTLKSKDISLWLGDGINFVQSKGRDGVPLNPLEFFRESGYLEKIQRQR